ncbi:SAP domain-containing protein [Aphelenchoides bicaudatus]|nr:SAP domain-containing protein [Aphelenchoides bicaudatus]
METKEDLQKLTVVQLREKLKGRNLVTTGTKNELIERLFESFQEEENLLSGTGTGGNDDLDVDALLGTNLGDHSLTSKEEALLLGINPKASKPEATKTTPQKTAPKPSSESVAKVAQHVAKNVETPAGDSTKSDEAAKPKREPIRAVGSPKSTDDSTDKKKQRLARFGLPIQKSTEDTTTAITPATPDSEKQPISLKSNAKLLDRAKRFGMPVSQGDDNGSNGVSKPKIPRISTGEVDDAKQRRMARFGGK